MRRRKGFQDPPDDACVVPDAPRNGDGYSYYNIDGDMRRAHRIEWERSNGPIPQGLFVCHSCDNRACVNVSHLFLGTPADNSADCVAKGRSVNASGHRNNNARILDSDIPIIRSLAKEGMRHWEIANRYRVGRSCITRIVSGNRRSAQ